MNTIYFYRVEFATPVGREMEKLLKIPIVNFNDILTVLRLANFTPLLNMFDFEGRKSMSSFIVDNVIENETTIATSEMADTILTMLAPLVSDQEDGPKAEDWDDPEEFLEEQCKCVQRNSIYQSCSISYLEVPLNSYGFRSFVYRL